mmetsp:Transcript_55290/g.153195  ORF Transcript_55290/g.153195 Transcript_55290/m.153195 type:complete len:314 (-) Transcript_55290:275-1216(-)
MAYGTPACVLRAAEARIGRGVQPQPQLIARDQPSLIVLFGEVEVSDPLLVQPDVPPDHDILLGLRLLDLLVVVGLHLHQGGEDVLVLVCVLVPQHHGLRVVLQTRARLPLEVLQGGIGVCLPELLKLVDLCRSDVPRPHLLLCIGYLHKPRQERAVLYERLPLPEVPIGILQRVVRQADSAQQHHNRVALRSNEAEEEDVALAAIVALQDYLPQGAVVVELHLLLLGADKVQDDAATGQPRQSAVAEPLAVSAALHDAGRVVDAAIPTCPLWQVLWVEGVLKFLGHVIQVIELKLSRGLVQQRDYGLLEVWVL